MGRDVEDGDLEYVGGHHLETPDHHDLAGGDPADGLGHQDTADDADEGHHDAEDAHPVVPVPEYGLVVNSKHPNETDYETPDTKPEDQDGVMDVFGLSAVGEMSDSLRDG